MSGLTSYSRRKIPSPCRRRENVLWTGQFNTERRYERFSYFFGFIPEFRSASRAEISIADDGQIIDNTQPDFGDGELENGEIARGVPFVTRGDAREVFDPIEEALESLAVVPKTNFRAQRVGEVLDGLVRELCKPSSLRCDNGPRFAGRMLDQWAWFNGVEIDFSRPGKLAGLSCGGRYVA